MVSLPHGGRLVNHVLSSRERDRALSEVRELPKVKVSLHQALEIENIAYGVYSPLEGFMTHEEVLSVLEDMRLPNDLPWTIPVVLDVEEDHIAGIAEGMTSFSAIMVNR